MKTIYKYQLLGDSCTFTLPIDSQILTVGEQNDGRFIWVLLETDNPKRDYTFETIGTGHTINRMSDLSYIGTIHMRSGLVWHIFENRGI